MTLDTSLIIGPPRRGYSQYIVLGPRAREGAHKNDVNMFIALYLLISMGTILLICCHLIPTPINVFIVTFYF